MDIKKKISRDLYLGQALLRRAEQRLRETRMIPADQFDLDDVLNPLYEEFLIGEEIDLKIWLLWEELLDGVDVPN